MEERGCEKGRPVLSSVERNEENGPCWHIRMPILPVYGARLWRLPTELGEKLALIVRRNDRAVYVTRVRAIDERRWCTKRRASSVFALAFGFPVSGSLSVDCVGEGNAENGYFYGAVRAFTQHDVYGYFLPYDDIGQTRHRIGAAYQGRVSDLEDVGQAIDLEGNGAGEAVYGKDFAGQFLANRLFLLNFFGLVRFGLLDGGFRLGLTGGFGCFF
jgi:hypothetical protein